MAATATQTPENWNTAKVGFWTPQESRGSSRGQGRKVGDKVGVKVQAPTWTPTCLRGPEPYFCRILILWGLGGCSSHRSYTTLDEDCLGNNHGMPTCRRGAHADTSQFNERGWLPQTHLPIPVWVYLTALESLLDELIPFSRTYPSGPNPLRTPPHRPDLDPNLTWVRADLDLKSPSWGLRLGWDRLEGGVRRGSGSAALGTFLHCGSNTPLGLVAWALGLSLGSRGACSADMSAWVLSRMLCCSMCFSHDFLRHAMHLRSVTAVDFQFLWAHTQHQSWITETSPGDSSTPKRNTKNYLLPENIFLSALSFLSAPSFLCALPLHPLLTHFRGELEISDEPI